VHVRLDLGFRVYEPEQLKGLGVGTFRFAAILVSAWMIYTTALGPYECGIAFVSSTDILSHFLTLGIEVSDLEVD
jgi:hypothetical protein